jgi:uncharacterized protein (DUF2141 family)
MTRHFFAFALLSLSVLASCRGAVKTRTGLPAQLQPVNAASTGTLEVHLTGIPAVRGQLFVELYDQATYFDYAQVLNERIVPVTATEMTVTLEHVAAGRYIAVGSHDANGNNELDTGLFGIPLEVYGFSRDARGALGPPDFSAGAFDFDGTTARVDVPLR